MGGTDDRETEDENKEADEKMDIGNIAPSRVFNDKIMLFWLLPFLLSCCFLFHLPSDYFLWSICNFSNIYTAPAPAHSADHTIVRRQFIDLRR